MVAYPKEFPEHVVKAYIECNVCPYCGTSDIVDIGESNHSANDRIIQCNNCEETWLETMQITGILAREDMPDPIWPTCNFCDKAADSAAQDADPDSEDGFLFMCQSHLNAWKAAGGEMSWNVLDISEYLAYMEYLENQKHGG